MKGLLLVITLAIFANAGPSILEENLEVVHQEAVDYINSVQSQWIASKDWAKSRTLSSLRSLLSLKTRKQEIFEEKQWGALLENLKLPSSFDARTAWPGCVGAIRDQGQCGSCWAFGAAETLSDRFCIVYDTKVVLSPQYLVDCDDYDDGCSGGYLDNAWYFLTEYGVPNDTCVPYVADEQYCGDTCANGKSLYLYYAKDVYEFTDPASIQAEVLSNGPIEVAFDVYTDFFYYSSGIYTYTWGSYEGGHAVKLIGWGLSGNTNYWICANSWGTSFGVNGYFYIAFGQVGIDSEGIAGVPN